MTTIIVQLFTCFAPKGKKFRDVLCAQVKLSPISGELIDKTFSIQIEWFGNILQVCFHWIKC